MSLALFAAGVIVGVAIGCLLLIVIPNIAGKVL